MYDLIQDLTDISFSSQPRNLVEFVFLCDIMKLDFSRTDYRGGILNERHENFI